MGEILTQKTGSLNLGVPGVMYLGGIAGLAALPSSMSGAMRRRRHHPVPALCLLLSLLAAFAAAALGGPALQLPDHHPPRQPERDRS